MVKCSGVLLTVLLLSACGSESPAAPTTTTPPPTPAAQLTSVSGGWANCLPAIGGFPGSCQFQGSIQNVGSGCATAIRGVVEFRSGQTPIGTTAAFAMNQSLVMRPGETLVYLTTTETLATVNATTTYVTTPSWTNVRCQ